MAADRSWRRFALALAPAVLAASCGSAWRARSTPAAPAPVGAHEEGRARPSTGSAGPGGAPRKPFLLRMPPDLAVELRAWAEHDMRSLNAQIVFLLREALARRAERAAIDHASSDAAEREPRR